MVRRSKLLWAFLALALACFAAAQTESATSPASVAWEALHEDPAPAPATDGEESDSADGEEGGGKGGEESGEEEEEEEESNVGVSMAFTLISALSFLMVLFYFLNHHDPDVKELSWDSLNQTISIFVAVLSFSAFNDWAEAYFIGPLFCANMPEKEWEEAECQLSDGAAIIDFGHMMFWFITTQVLCGVLARAVGPYKIENVEGMDEEEREELAEQTEIYVKCGSTLAAHITGFAAINFFSTVQDKWFGASPFSAALGTLVALVTMLILQRIFDEIRERIAKPDENSKKDLFEKLWDEEVEEAEDDVMGLALSFTFVNAIRFLFDGCLPNHEGKEECEGPSIPQDYFFHHTAPQQMLLIGLGIMWAGIVFVLKALEPECLEEEAIKERPRNQRKYWRLLARLNEGIFVSTRMCFAWAFFFGGQEFIASFPALEGQEELVAIINALSLSLICLVGLIPLDMLRDATWTGPKCDAGIDGILRSLGLIIGFSWEQCFDASVDSIAEKSNESNLPFVNVHTTKMFLTIFCGCLLIPAWFKYILKYCVQQGWHPLARVKDASSAMNEFLTELEKGDDMDENEIDAEELEKKIKSIENFEKRLEAVKEHAERSLPRLTRIRNKKKSTMVEEELEEGKTAEALKEALKEPLLGKSEKGAEEGAGLKNEVARLKSELEKEKEKSKQAQLMLDDTLQKMMTSMKQMHVTVSRIEGTA